MLSFFKRHVTIIIAVAVIGGSFGGGMYFGEKRAQTPIIKDFPVINAENSDVSADFSVFWQAWNTLNKKYVPTHSTSTPSDQEKIYGAIKGLADSYGDPYTIFFPPVESAAFKTEIKGNFEGVGMEVGMKDGVITIIAPLKDTPAARAGILSGDKLLKIDDISTAGLSIDEAVRLIRGKRGTVVRLNILHLDAKQPEEIKVTRDTINIPTLDDSMRKDGVYVIRLYSFSENSAALFRNAIQRFYESGADKLVLDLRGNPGGYLEAAVDMASWFLPKGKIVVKEDSGGNGEDQILVSAGYDVFKDRNLGMVILVDGGSASASEILAGALVEHGVAKIVGVKTFGKGSVQELMPLTSDTSLKITVARWMTPNGVSISQQGLTPDVIVPITPEEIQAGKDPQMDKAAEMLLKK